MKAMKKGYTIHTVSIYDSIVIYSHRFNGLDEIRKAVGLFMHDNREPYQASEKRHQPVEGVHVLCNYDPYPTFDEYDAMCEDRDYENYYFLDRPFTKRETDAIAAVYPRMSFCKVYEGMSLPAGMPVIYYYGDGDTMQVAYPSDSKGIKIPGNAFTRFFRRLFKGKVRWGLMQKW